ncbi:RNA polymerase sigma factor SigJ [Nonomuraea ceibae]|uniref:RNA polymerase sigma factor SigJ n=1 Tax=Nonomuraea ceibae TaxID=1935170 RepID=UPI001C5D2505|nr:RNA polymerase sigma factor SigJ [Nonomuraea ceibae]
MSSGHAQSQAQVVRSFQAHRNLLFTLAYDILGKVADAEDVVQEAWLAWSGADHAKVENPRAYLVRVTARLALNQLNRSRSLREDYVGPWLPEPMVLGSDPAEDVDRSHAIAFGLMVVLESLSPLERVAFVLREAFGYEHAEIAQIMDRSPAAVRQLVHRAREHVEARRPRFAAHQTTAQAAAERFLAAALGGSVSALMDVLAPDVTLWTDGGGRVPAALRAVHGSDKVSRLMAQVAPTDRLVRARWVTDAGPPTALLLADGSPFAVLVAVPDPGGQRVREIYGILNPDKLHHLARQ